MAIYFRSSIPKNNNRRFWIRKNKCIINLRENQPDIDQIYLFVKDLCKVKYQYSINNHRDAGNLNDSKAFMEY